jgi:hypothetical protein
MKKLFTRLITAALIVVSSACTPLRALVDPLTELEDLRTLHLLRDWLPAPEKELNVHEELRLGSSCLTHLSVQRGGRILELLALGTTLTMLPRRGNAVEQSPTLRGLVVEVVLLNTDPRDRTLFLTRDDAEDSLPFGKIRLLDHLTLE